jgi:hypothetical protein
MPTPGHPSITAPVWFGSPSTAFATVVVFLGARRSSSTVAPGSPRASTRWLPFSRAYSAPSFTACAACRCRAGRGVPIKVSRIYSCSVQRSLASSATSNPPVEWTT